MKLGVAQARELKPLSVEELNQIKKEFIKQSNLAAKGKVASLAWYDSLVEPWKKELKAQRPVVVIDLGGSYIRTGVLIWSGDKFKWLKSIKKEKAVNEHLNPLAFTAWLVKQTLPLIKESRAKRVGFVFSYPHQPQKFGAHVTGVVTQLTKALVVPGIVGVDIGKLYLKNLKQRGVILKKFVTLNDTVALALSVPKAVAGVVIGTGANICSQHPGLKNLRNLEAGSFNGVPLSAMAACVDLLEHPGIHLMEKQSSGRYQYRNWAYASLLSGMRKEIGREIIRQGARLESWLVTEAIKGRFSHLKSVKLTKVEKKKLQKLAKIILENSWQMWGAAVAATIEMNQKQVKDKIIKVPVTGGVILNDNKYLNGLRKTAEKLTGKGVELVKITDPIKGAAVATLLDN